MVRLQVLAALVIVLTVGCVFLASLFVSHAPAASIGLRRRSPAPR